MRAEEVERISHLARVELSAAERSRFAAQLSSILEYFQTLQKVDTEGVAAAAHPEDLTGPLRPDTPVSWPDPASLVDAAAQHDADHFVVPLIL